MDIFELYVKQHISAAHLLRGYPGECAELHGHNWKIEVFIRCKKLNEIGIGIDFKAIKKAVKEVLEGLDHKNLNELSIFEQMNPTAENIAKFLYDELSARFNSDHATVSKINVSETPGIGTFYWKE